MAYFDWDEKLATGIQKIDEQHKELISLVNELHEAMRKGKAKDIVSHVLEGLKRYTGYHFSTEEKAFEAYLYSGRVEHKKSHSDLIRQLDDLIEKHSRGELAISVDTLEFLTKWIKNHIMKEDMLYAPFLRGKTID
jgi:hemerythrin-like metal-binding protein